MPANTTKNMMGAHFGMLLWALIVGLSFPAVGLMSEGLPPLSLTSIRFAIAALAIWPLVWRRSPCWPILPGVPTKNLVRYDFIDLLGLETVAFVG